MELDGTSPWHYDADEKTYYRSYDNGKHEGAVKGEYIPNPDLLWKQRLENVMMVQGKVTEEDRTRNKPSPVTYALFEHWQKVNQDGE